jgi:LysM repeat protein/Txe/YoeB family toxin of Txe-Axe toxin-antitoxin module
MITPKPGYIVDPQNPNAVVPDPNYNPQATQPQQPQQPQVQQPAAPAAPAAAPVQQPAAQPAPVLPAPAPIQPVAPVQQTKQYTVMPGDTLGAIALKFGVPLSSITGYRSGDPNRIFSGETLTIGQPAAAAPAQPQNPQQPQQPGDQQPGGGDSPTGIGDDELSRLYMQAFMDTMREDMSGNPAAGSPSDIFSNYGVDASNLQYGFQTNPTQTVQDLLTQVMQATALPDAKSHITDLAKQIEDLENERDSKFEAIDNDPFLSAGTKEKQKDKINEKYDRRILARTNSLKLLQDAYDSARQESQFAVSTAINLFDRNRVFDQNKLEFAVNQAEKRLETIREMTKLNPAQYKEVNGGLYDLGSGEWIIEPTNNATLGGLTKDQRTYLNQIQDNARQDANIKDFPAIRASFETARSAVQKRNGPGDIVLMRMLAKITDPTTGVREEEFQTFAGAQSTLGRYGIQLTKQMWAGDRLSDAGRLALYQQVKDIYNQRLSAYENSYNFFNGQAVDAGLPSGSVMPTYIAPSKATSQNQPTGNGWF